jgi:hypothetical protein
VSPPHLRTETDPVSETSFSLEYLTRTKSENQVILKVFVRWVPYHHGMALPQVADGGDALQFWREAANILNKQLQTADKGWSSRLGVRRGTNNSSP